MASVSSRLISLGFRLVRAKGYYERRFRAFESRACPAPPAAVRRRCQVVEGKTAGRSVYWLSPPRGGTGRRVLYLHGGAYISNFFKPQWRFVERIINGSGCTVIAPEYPRAPLYTYQTAYDMLSELYDHITRDYDPAELVFMGDSAGGGMCLALAMKLHAEGRPLPGQMILLSPWLDITLNNPEVVAIERQDPFLGVNGLRLAGMSWAGAEDPSCYMLSPINGPLEGLCPVTMYCGTRDVLLADARKLALRMQAESRPCIYHEYPDMFHVWMLLNIPEARPVVDDIISLLQQG